MTTLIVKNLFETLNIGNNDKDVGITLSYLTGTESFSMYCTEIESGKTVNAHYHEEGVEFYQIISGSGKKHTGEPTDGLSTIWNNHIEVRQGDFFMIDQKQMHQLENTGKENLVVVFGCTTSHITTDRVVVDSFV